MRERDPYVAAVLEILGGFFGFLGLGWMYAGRPAEGAVLLIVYWILDWVIGVLLAVVTLGLWCLVLPAQNLIFGVISGYRVYRWLEEQQL